MKLFSRKRSEENKAPAAGTPGQKLRHKLSLRALFNPILLTVLTVMLVLAVLIYFQFSMIGQERRNELARSQADRAAAALGGQLSGYADTLARLGRSPSLIAVLDAQDQAALTQWLQQWQTLFPEALHLRFIVLGDEQLDETTESPLGYACLELVRNAESGQPPLFEAHRYGSNLQHIDVARAVQRADGKTIGSLLLTLDVRTLQAWLSPLLTQDGYVELRQHTSGGALILATAGNPALQEASEGYAAEIAGSTWSLIYRTTSSSKALRLGEQMGLAASFGSALLIMLISIFIISTLAVRIIRNDLAITVRQTVELWSGRRQHNFDVKLAESLDVLRALEDHLSLQQPAQVQPKAERAEQMQKANESEILVEEMPADEAPPPASPAFMNPGSIVVEELDDNAQPTGKTD